MKLPNISASSRSVSRTVFLPVPSMNRTIFLPISDYSVSDLNDVGSFTKQAPAKKEGSSADGVLWSPGERLGRLSIEAFRLLEQESQNVIRRLILVTSLCEKSMGSAIGRRNRLPHHCKPSSYRTVGQAVSPVERLFTQTLTHGAEMPTSRSVSRWAYPESGICPTGPSSSSSLE